MFCFILLQASDFENIHFTKDMKQIITPIIAAMLLTFASAPVSNAKNYGALEIAPKGITESNGTKMAVVWRYFNQEEIIKISSEKGGEESYEICGKMSHPKIGEMELAQRFLKKSPTQTSMRADMRILGTPPRGSSLEPAFQFHLPRDVFDGRLFADGAPVSPDTKKLDAKELSFQSESGELKISGNLNVHLRDSTRQRILKYRTISIVADDLGNGKYSLELDFSFDKNKKPVTLAGEYRVRENEDYQKFEVIRNTLKSSALDFSFLLDAPAGKYGFVKTDGENFTFEKLPGSKVKFFGSNICQSATIPEKDEAKALADEFAASGFNTARLHQFSSILRGTKSDSAALNQQKMDKFDYLFAELKKRGIYSTIDFYSSGKLYPHEYDDVQYRGDNMKALFFASDKARATLKRFISNFLNHINPYTGLAYKDDPALFFASIINENAIARIQNFVVRTHLDRDIFEPIFKKWEEKNAKFLGEKPYTERFQLFLIDRYEKYYAEMSSHIKSIAPHLLLTDQTNGGCLLTVSMSEKYDLFDCHVYNGHPLFYEKRFTVPLYVDPSDPIGNFAGAFKSAGALKLMGKPSAVTEWDYVRPNPKAAAGGLIVGAYAALNGIDGLWQFCYTHNRQKILSNMPLGLFDTAGDAVRTLANKIGALMYLRGDVSESDVTIPMIVESNLYANGNTARAYELSGGLAKLSLAVKTGNIVADSAESAKKALPKNSAAALYADKKMAPKNISVKAFDAFDGDVLKKVADSVKLGRGAIDAENGVFASSTGELFLDSKNAIWKAVTPRTEVFIQGCGATQKGAFAEVKNIKGWSIAAVCSVDGKPLDSSDRMLIAHLTDAMNDGQRFGKRDFSVVLEWGGGCYLLKRADSEITFSSELEGFKCHALDTSGKRIAEIPVERKNGRAKISISTHNSFGSVIAYELSRK